MKDAAYSLLADAFKHCAHLGWTHWASHPRALLQAGLASGPMTRHLLVNLEKSSFWEIEFFGNSGWNWGGLGVSGRSARTIRNFSFELWQDLVLHGIRKSTFQPLTVNWNLNCTRNGSQNPPFCPGSPEHLYYFFLDISPPDFPK